MLSASLRSFALAFALAICGCQAPGAPVPQPVRISLASFVDNDLFACDDYTFPQVAGQAPVTAEQKEKELAGVTGVRVAKPCAEQFADRAALASCTVVRVGLTLKTYHYDLRGVEDSDIHMRACLSRQGDWRRNADATDQARIKDARVKFEKAMADMAAYRAKQ